MARIGLFGGSFNPIHNGHLHLIESARQELQLDRVILVPAGISPFKQSSQADVPSGAERCAMCRLAVASLPYCTVDDCEIRREGVSYTVDTVGYFRQQYPDAELILLVGSDMFLSFHRWWRYQAILQEVALAVVSRETADEAALAAQQQFLLQYGKIFLCHTPAYPISSTKIREIRKKGGNFSCYLPEKVVEYIVSHMLYLDAGEKGVSAEDGGVGNV